MADIWTVNRIVEDHNQDAKKYQNRIAELEAEQLDLWRFVIVADAVAYDAPTEGDTWIQTPERIALMERYEAARTALDKWVMTQ